MDHYATFYPGPPRGGPSVPAAQPAVIQPPAPRRRSPPRPVWTREAYYQHIAEMRATHGDWYPVGLPAHLARVAIAQTSDGLAVWHHQQRQEQPRHVAPPPQGAGQAPRPASVEELTALVQRVLEVQAAQAAAAAPAAAPAAPALPRAAPAVLASPAKKRRNGDAAAADAPAEPLVQFAAATAGGLLPEVVAAITRVADRATVTKGDGADALAEQLAAQLVLALDAKKFTTTWGAAGMEAGRPSLQTAAEKADAYAKLAAALVEKYMK